MKILLGVLSMLLPFLLFQGFGFLEGFELQVLDFMQTLRGPRLPHSDIILVTVDDQTTAALHDVPPRQYYAQAVRALSRYGVKAFVLDFLFLDEGNREADAELASVTRELGNVIHAFQFNYWDDEEKNGIAQNLPYTKYSIQPRNEANFKFIRGDSVRAPYAFFSENFNKAGLITVIHDSDARARRIPLFFKNHGAVYPALSLVALGEYLQTPLDSLRLRKNFWGYSISLETPKASITAPINELGQLLLNFYGELKTFKSYSILQIHQALQDLEERRAPRVPLHDFAGKIVVIGTVETGMDIYPSAFADDFSAVGLHATAISNLLKGEALRQLPWYVDAGTVLVLVLLLNAGMTLAGKIDKTRETAYGSAFFVLTILVFNLVAYLLLFKGLHLAPAMLKINSALALFFLSVAFYEKSLRVKLLNREVQRLESDSKEKLAHIEQLNTKISERDNQYKTVNFFIGEIEGILNNPSVERPDLLANPLMKMQIIKEQLKNELERRRSEKEILEAEKEKLNLKIAAYRGLEGGEQKKEGTTAKMEPPPNRFEEMKRVQDNYKAFEQKTKSPYYCESAFGMVTAAPGNRNNHDANKTKLQEIFAQIGRISPFDSTVLITGETGTGKELVAQAIRRNSSRKNGPFVVLNCGAIPEGLIESELFGHEKGAFTGAVGEYAGVFEQANGGTIFLDEIGDLPPHLQTRLLRVLQEKKVRRLHGKKDIDIDVRVIAATHRDLQKLIQDEKFREDLYFRLDVANIHLPPLRERREEIPHLIHYFLAKLGETHGPAKRLTEEALMALILYDWPGNIRELQNLVEKVYVTTPGEAIRLSDLPKKIQQGYREVVGHEEILMWDAIERAAQTEMENLLATCQQILRAGEVEAALQSGQLKLWGAACEDCYEYMRAYLDGKGSLFPQDRREALAKQIIVAMSEQLADWCGNERIFNTKEQAWRGLEKLLGRTRRMIDNWKREVGAAKFYSTI
jgi:transcriptional regulator with PAS, ATPase and Fis domain/CHASE2 domain-containing sensor protein